MKVIGLTGGVGSGKSTVTEILKIWTGYQAVQTDAIWKGASERPGEPGYREIAALFGDGNSEEDDGQIDRRKTGNIIFHDSRVKNLSREYYPPDGQKAGDRR